VVAENSFFWKAAFLRLSVFSFLWRYLMKRILLFLLLFFIFAFSIVSGVCAAPAQGPEKIVVHPLFNFDQIFVDLRQILIQLFFQYYHYALGFIFVLLLLSYFQGMMEGRKMRRERERREREYRRDYRERIEMQRDEKFFVRERAMIRRFGKVDEEAALRMQEEMYRYDSETSEEKLGLTPIKDDDEVLSNNIDRAGPFWRPDGSEEGSEPFFGDTATISESSTVIMRDGRRDRIHRGMEDEDDNGGY
jgi:ABC-type multidrug transport system fused ATPase/permease subunit